MLSVSKINDAGAAHHYLSEKDDYYRSDAAAAEWYGAGAERAGRRGEVDQRAFREVLEGRIGGQQVGKPGTRTIKGEDGKERKVPNHAPGWDCTFSAPKSVSVAALVHGDKRLLDAHDRAVRAALDALEKHSAITRQRAENGSYSFRETGNLTAAVFRHASNREQEPQLHSHAVVANATFDETVGKWLSLCSKEGLYPAQREVGATYTNELAAAARELGYSIDWSVNDKGHPSFELGEIPEAERTLFSGRNAAIEAELARRGLTREMATPKQKEKATLATRQPKEHVPAAELQARWSDTARSRGFPVGKLQPVGKRPNAADRERGADAAVADAAAHLAERTARFTERELMTEARVMAQGRANDAELGAAVQRARERGELRDTRTEVRVPGGERQSVAGLTTAYGQQIEKDMLKHADDIARNGRFGLKPGERQAGENTAETIDARVAAAEERSGYALTPEQRVAIHSILGGDSGLSIVQGYAGTAKTSNVMAIVAEHARAGGWNVRAIAPTASAAKTLGDAIGAESSTVAAVNAREPKQGHKPELVIVDEAGMIDAESMRQLLLRAEKTGARVLLTGDEKQIGSVGAGRAFEQIKAAHADSTSELTDIKRQRSAELRQAVYHSLLGDAGAALGKVHVAEVANRDEAAERIADAFMADHADGKNTIVVTLSRADRAAINAAIQQRLEDAGEVRNAQDVTTLRDRQWTGAEKADASRYQAGDLIQANRLFRRLGLEKGDTATVRGIKDGKVTIETQDGKTHAFDPKRMNDYSVLEPECARFGEGDRLVTKGSVRAVDAGGKTVEIKNGTELNISRIEDGHIEASTDRGEAYRIDARLGVRADLCYAQTANQAQGRTVENVIGYMRSTQTKLADQKRMYVTLSRAKDKATIVTDSKKQLAAAIARNAGQKESALDESRPRAGDSVRVREPIEARHSPGDGTNRSEKVRIEAGTDLRIERETNGQFVARDPHGTGYEIEAKAGARSLAVTDRPRTNGRSLAEWAKNVRAVAQAGAHSIQRGMREFDKHRRERRFDRNTMKILRGIDERARAQRRAVRRKYGAFSVVGAAKVAEINRQAVQARAKVEGMQIKEHARREARAEGRRAEWRDYKQESHTIRTSDGRVAVSRDGGKTFQRVRGIEAFSEGRRAKQREKDMAAIRASEERHRARGGGETMDSQTLAKAALETFARDQANPFARQRSDAEWNHMAAKNGIEYDRDGNRYARDDKGRLHSEALEKRDFHMTETRGGREVARETEGQTSRPLWDLANRMRIERAIDEGRRAEFARLDRMAHEPKSVQQPERTQSQERVPERSREPVRSR